MGASGEIELPSREVDVGFPSSYLTKHILPWCLIASVNSGMVSGSLEILSSNSKGYLTGMWVDSPWERPRMDCYCSQAA